MTVRTGTGQGVFLCSVVVGTRSRVHNEVSELGNIL